MSQAPSWWYAVSGVFFAFGIAFYIVLVVLLVRLMVLVKDVGAKIDALSKRLTSVAEKVDGLVVEVKRVTANVGSQASGIMGSVNSLAQTVSGRTEMLSLIMSAITMFSGFMRARKAKQQ